MGKISSYKKLKLQNLELIRDLRLIVMNDKSVDATLSLCKWRIKFEQENRFVFGNQIGKTLCKCKVVPVDSCGLFPMCNGCSEKPIQKNESKSDRLFKNSYIK